MTSLFILSFLSPTILFVLSLICLVVIHIARSHKSRSAFAKLPQPSSKSPVLGHSLLLLEKGVDISLSSFNTFYRYAVEFNKFGLYGFGLMLQRTVHVFSPDHFEKVMTSTKHINKSTAYYPYTPWLGTGLIISGGEKWHKDRKMLTPAFHFKIIDQFNPIINKHATILCNKIKETLNCEMTNCVSTLSSCALDTICETSMGLDMQTQTSGENNFSRSFIEFHRLATKRALNTFVNKSDLLYALTPNGQHSKRLIKNMHDFTGNIVAQRKKQITSTPSKSNDPSRKKSLLDLMLNIHLNGGDLDLEDIRFQLDNFAFAGHDTVSNALAFILVCLANYPNVQERVRTEISEIIGDCEEVTSEHLSNFAYLEMVIKETLRLYPPVPFTGRHLQEDFDINGYLIPKGTDVWLNYFALHRNPNCWPDPNKFDPERFSTENSIDRHPFAFLPFSAGNRNCIGQRYAKAFLKIVIAQIVKQYEIVPVTKIEDIKLCFEMTINTVEPIRLIFNSLLE